MRLLNGVELTWGHVALGSMIFLVSLGLSAAALWWVLLKLPSDYFRGLHPPPFMAGRHPALRWVGLLLKNLSGVVLIGLGLILLLPGIPGQGLLVVLLGTMLLNFPGKRRLEQKLVGRPAVLRKLNWLRGRFGRPPLEVNGEAAEVCAKAIDNGQTGRSFSREEKAHEVFVP